MITVLTQTAIDQAMPNWWRESYTLLVIGAVFFAGLAFIRAARPLVEAVLKVQEHRTQQEASRHQAAQCVERTAIEVRATVAEAAKVTAAQADVARAQGEMTRDLIRLSAKTGS